MQEVDKQEGVWTVELHNKIEGRYNMEVIYQHAFDGSASEASILPLQTLETDGQKGYVVVRSSDRLRVLPVHVGQGLRQEDARGISHAFGGGDLSDAILCYRTTQANYDLSVTVIRHASADVLPARVKHVRITSVVSDDLEMVTRVRMGVDVGDLRFLRTELPQASDIWSVFVNGRPTTPLVEGETLLIPLDRKSSGHASVEFIYGGEAGSRWWSRRRTFVGPKFDLPLTDIKWSFYMPANYRYYGFDGTMKQDLYAGAPRILAFDEQHYTALSKDEMANNLLAAEEVLKKGEDYARTGRQREARAAFEMAMHYSQGQEDFNEDARIQYRNLAKKQAVVALVNRRDELKLSHNMQDGAELRKIKGFKEGNWSEEYGRQIEQSLSSNDSDALNVMAEKLLDQQAAASVDVPAIRVTIPLQGKQLEFHRALQINPAVPLTVEVKAAGLSGQNAWGAVIAMLLLFCGTRWGLKGLSFKQSEGAAK